MAGEPGINLRMLRLPIDDPERIAYFKRRWELLTPDQQFEERARRRLTDEQWAQSHERARNTNWDLVWSQRIHRDRRRRQRQTRVH